MNWRKELTHYTIDEDHVVHGPFSFDDWLDWALEVEDFAVYERLCIVARTQIDGDCEVRTDFLRGMNIQFRPGGPPLLFETMVFGGEHAQEIDRYATWAEAEAGHQRMVERVMAGKPED